MQKYMHTFLPLIIYYTHLSTPLLHPFNCMHAQNRQPYLLLLLAIFSPLNGASSFPPMQKTAANVPPLIPFTSPSYPPIPLCNCMSNKGLMKQPCITPSPLFLFCSTKIGAAPFSAHAKQLLHITLSLNSPTLPSFACLSSISR